MSPWTIACQTPQSMGILQARVLEWAAMPYSRESSQPRYWTLVSCKACGFCTIWASRKAQNKDGQHRVRYIFVVSISFHQSLPFKYHSHYKWLCRVCLTLTIFVSVFYSLNLFFVVVSVLTFCWFSALSTFEWRFNIISFSVLLGDQ